MGRLLSLITLSFVIGCATSERVAPAPVILPDDPGTVVFDELQPKLRTLAWQATEAYYRDDWKSLAETASTIERAGKLLKSSKSPPPKLQATLADHCDKLSQQATQLREAAEVSSADRVSQHLQQVHNLIRTLRPEAP